LKAVAAREHEVQNDEVKFLANHKKETFFAGRGDDNLVLLPFQPFAKGVSNFRFVFNNQNPQGIACLSES
jgi:hypothetical protein